MAGTKHLFVFFSLFLASCANVQQSINNFKDTMNSLKTTGANNISQLPGGLEHLFLDHPYDDNKPLKGQFPRVAFTVLSVPYNHDDSAAFLDNLPHGCWKMSAIVWLSATQKSDVSPFDICIPDIIQYNVAHAAYTRWFNVSFYVDLDHETTGNVRTDGPKPPENVFPDGIKYRNYWHSTVSTVSPQEKTMEGLLWSSILSHLDFNPSSQNDRRFWVVKYIPVEQR